MDARNCSSCSLHRLKESQSFKCLIIGTETQICPSCLLISHFSRKKLLLSELSFVDSFPPPKKGAITMLKLGSHRNKLEQSSEIIQLKLMLADKMGRVLKVNVTKYIMTILKYMHMMSFRHLLQLLPTYIIAQSLSFSTKCLNSV